MSAGSNIVFSDFKSQSEVYQSKMMKQIISKEMKYTDLPTYQPSYLPNHIYHPQVLPSKLTSHPSHPSIPKHIQVWYLVSFIVLNINCLKVVLFRLNSGYVRCQMSPL